MKICILHHKNKLLSKLKKQKLRHLEQQMAQHEKRKRKTGSGTNQNMVPQRTIKTRPDKPINRMRLGLIIQFTTGHIWLARHLRYYLENKQMDLTCHLCNQPNTKEDSIHIWATCESQAIKIARKKAIAQCRLTIRKAPSSEAQARLADLLINFPNFVWSKYELCQFLPNESVMSLMENHKEEQFVSRN